MGKRHIENLTINQPYEFVNLIVNDFFNKEGFVYTNYKGEMVWKKGNGLLTVPQFIRLDYQNGVVTLQAWIKHAILPGVYCGEMDLDGFVAAAIKGMLRNRVNDLMHLLAQPVQQAQPAYTQQPVYAGGQPNDLYQQPQNQNPTTYAQQPMQQNPIPIAVHNPTGKATLALVMGLVSIVSWLLPIAGFITTIIGIVAAKSGMKSTERGRAVAGLVLSIIFLVFSIINSIAGAVMNVLNMTY